MALNYASHKQRLLAFAIDCGVIVVAQLCLGGGTVLLYEKICDVLGISAELEKALILSQFCGGFLFIAYFTFSVGFFGNTLGKYWMGIKIIYVVDGNHRAPTLKQAYLRSLAYLMSSWTYMIGFILPYFRKDRMALHDLLCGSQVVQQAPNEVSSGLEPYPASLRLVPPTETPTTEPTPSGVRTGTDH